MNDITVDSSAPINYNYHSKVFESPVNESLWTSKTLALWVLNVLTLGIYSSVEMISKIHQVQKTSVNLELLNEDIKQVQKNWNALERKMSEIERTINSDKLDEENILSSLAQFKQQVSHTKEERLLGNVSTGITQIALIPIKFFGALIANILTLGIYGVVQNHSLEQQMYSLEGKLKFEESQFDTERNERCDRLILQEKLLTAFVKLQAEMKVVSSTDDGKARLDLIKQSTVNKQKLDELRADFNRIATDNERVRRDLETANSIKVGLEAFKRQAELTALQLNGTIINLRAEVDRVKLQNATQANQIATFNHSLTAANSRANTAENQRVAIQTRLTAAEAQVRNLQAQVKPAAPGTVDLNKLGPVAPQYTQQPDDKDIAGAFEDAASGHAKLYTGRTLAGLVETAFDVVFDKLNAAAKAVDKPKVQFSDSYLISAKESYRQVIFGNLVLELVMGAKVYKPDCHGYALKFNEHVEVRASSPTKVQFVKVDAATKVRKTEVITVFSHTDELTPNPGFSAVPNGVDPVSARWILNKLNAVEMAHLMNLINEPLIADSHADLIATKAWFKNPLNKERAKLVNTAHSLICEMAAVIGNKYLNVLTPHWQNKTDLDNDKLFEKEQLNLDKVKDEVNRPKAAPAKPWDVLTHIECFENTDYTVMLPTFAPPLKHYNPITRQYEGAAVNQTLRAMIESFVDKYKIVSDAISEAMIANPKADLKSSPAIPKDAALALALLNQQYYISHYVFNSGCLFANMLASFFAHTKLTSNALTAYAGVNMPVGELLVKELKKAIANLLDKPAIRARFEKIIAKDHKVALTPRNGFNPVSKEVGMSVDGYQHWLRNGNTTHLDTVYFKKGDINSGTIQINIDQGRDLGDLELSLCAELLGVTFRLFSLGDELKLDHLGLMVPKEPRFYGADTNSLQTIDMLNWNPGTYYALYPKLNAPEYESYDVLQAITHLNAYWSECDRTRLVNG